VVASGGTLVTQSGKRISGQEMAGELVLELIAAAEANGCGYWFGIEDKLYINSAKKTDFEKFLFPMKIYDASEAPDITQIPIAQMSISELNPGMKAVLKEFETKISYTIMLDFKGDEDVDINAVGVDKAAGLRQLAQYYGLPVEQIISVGDGLNDFEMVGASFG
jgi:HAD superfamily hydrolase (TIGR01484 family)